MSCPTIVLPFEKNIGMDFAKLNKIFSFPNKEACNTEINPQSLDNKL